jgi:lipopolysaccharide heptosyltransferase I
MNAPSRILIIRLSALGDILHTLPAFSSLRASFPNAQIDWLVSHKTKFLLSAVPGIHSLHVLNTSNLLKIPPDKESWRQLMKLMQTIRAQHYDLAIDFQGLLKSALLCALSGAKVRMGFSRELVRERPAHWFYQRTLPKPNSQIHITELNQQLAALAGADKVRYCNEFMVANTDIAYVDSLIKQHKLDHFIVLNPGGGWPTKIWSPEKYGALADKILAELNMQVVVTTGPAEDPLYRTIAEHCRTAAPIHLKVSFLQLIPLLSKAHLFVGGDTGPLHLACALGIPVAAIFGPTCPLRNGPWSAGDEVITHHLNCAPCYGRNCGIGTICMDISVEEVFEALVRRLENIKKEASLARA